MIQASQFQSALPPSRCCPSIPTSCWNTLTLRPATMDGPSVSWIHRQHTEDTHLCRSPDVPGFWPGGEPCISCGALEPTFAQVLPSPPAYGFVDTSLGLNSLMALSLCVCVYLCCMQSSAMLCVCSQLGRRRPAVCCPLSPLPFPARPKEWMEQWRTRTDLKRGEAHNLLADGMPRRRA